MLLFIYAFIHLSAFYAESSYINHFIERWKLTYGSNFLITYNNLRMA